MENNNETVSKGELQRTKRLILAALKVWELKQVNPHYHMETCHNRKDNHEKNENIRAAAKRAKAYKRSRNGRDEGGSPKTQRTVRGSKRTE